MNNKEILNMYVKKGKFKFKGIKLSKKNLKKLSRIVFVGVGDGYASAIVASSNFERLSDCLVSVYPAGEFRYSPTIVDKNTLLIAISQNGAEEDIVASIKRVRSIGGRAIAVCCDKDSTVSKLANYVLNPIESGFENESFLLTLLAICVGRSYGFVSKDFNAVALKLAEMLSQKQNNAVDELNEFLSEGEIIACGRGADYGVAVKIAFTNGVSASACQISELSSLSLENKKILAIVSSKDFLNDIMFYLDIAKQRGERLLVLASDDVSEIMPKTLNIVSFHGSLPIFNPLLISTGLCRGDQWSSAKYHSSNNATDERCSPLQV